MKSKKLIRIYKRLDVDLDTAFRSTLLQGREQVGDIVPRVSVKTGTQALLIEVVGNQTDTATQDEETVKDTHLHVVLNFLGGEGTGVAHEVNETDSNATVNVQDQVVLLRGGDGLNSDGVVEQLGAGEVLLGELLDQLDTKIRVVTGLDTVTNTRNYARLVMRLN